MRATILDSNPVRDVAVLAVALLLSTVGHAVVAGGASAIPATIEEEDVWVEMTIQRTTPEPAVPEPEPEPEPEQKPEPEPAPEPEPEPEPIDFEEIPEAPPEEIPPPPPDTPRKIVQGLDNASFMENGGTNLTVRRGTTTATRQTDETMSLDEEDSFTNVPYTRVSTPPKKRFVPALDVPDSVIDAEIEGRVEVSLIVDQQGKVLDVSVTASLHPDADAACVDVLRRSRWKPGTVDGRPVTVNGVPYSCKFEMQG